MLVRRGSFTGKVGRFLPAAVLFVCLVVGTALGQEDDGEDKGRREDFAGVEKSGGTFRERVRERLHAVRESSEGRPRTSSFESDDGPRAGSSQQDVSARRERIREQFRSSRDEQVRLKSEESISAEKNRIQRLDEKYKPRARMAEQDGNGDGSAVQLPARPMGASVESEDDVVFKPLSSRTSAASSPSLDRSTSTTTTSTAKIPEPVTSSSSSFSPPSSSSSSMDAIKAKNFRSPGQKKARTRASFISPNLFVTHHQQRGCQVA